MTDKVLSRKDLFVGGTSYDRQVTVEEAIGKVDGSQDKSTDSLDDDIVTGKPSC